MKIDSKMAKKPPSEFDGLQHTIVQLKGGNTNSIKNLFKINYVKIRRYFIHHLERNSKVITTCRCSKNAHTTCR